MFFDRSHLSMRAALVLFLAIVSPSAFAAEEELVFALEPGYALLTADTDRHGAGGHLSVAYGVTDAVWLTLSLGGSHQLSRGDLEGLTLLEAFGGITLALDVLRTIPFIEGLIGVVGAKIADTVTIGPTVRLGVGFDFLLTPAIGLGAVFRYRPVPEDFGDDYYTIDGRLTWRFEP